MKPVIKVNNLSKEFLFHKKEPGIKASVKNLFNRQLLVKNAVDNISFEIQEGEFLGFIGPNGAGKTTTLKMLSGILCPSAGHIEVLGFNPFDRKHEFLKQFGIVFGQKNQIHPDLPPIETFNLIKSIYELSDKEYKNKLDELICLLGIESEIKIQARKLSLGQKMKCELATAFLHNPRILFLDEPTIGLDINAQRKVRQFLEEYNKNHKTTIILTSHYIQDIEKLCNRAIVINKGSLVFDGDFSNLSRKYTKNKKIEIIVKDTSIPNLKKIHQSVTIREIDNQKISLEIPREQVSSAISEIMKHLQIEDITIKEVDIEEIIADIFEKNESHTLKTK